MRSYGPPATEPAITMASSARSIFPLTTSSSQEPSTFSDCGQLAACRLSSPTMASLSFSSLRDADRRASARAGRDEAER